jgi:hypothetical protein
MARQRPQPDKWRPSGGDIITIVAWVGAVIMWQAQPIWQIGVPVTAIAIIIVIAAAVRHHSHPLVRIPFAVATVAVLILVSWRPAWDSFRKDYPHAAFNWPITLNPPSAPPAAVAEPPDMPPTNLPGPPLSKWGKVMFLCQPPNGVTLTHEEAMALLRRNADIYGKALGVDVVINELPYGIRFDVTANGTEGKQNLQIARRYTVQLERASNGIFVTFSLDYVGAYAVLAQFPIERESEQARMWMGQTEGLGFPHGACRLI